MPPDPLCGGRGCRCGAGFAPCSLRSSRGRVLGSPRCCWGFGKPEASALPSFRQGGRKPFPWGQTFWVLTEHAAFPALSAGHPVGPGTCRSSDADADASLARFPSEEPGHDKAIRKAGGGERRGPSVLLNGHCSVFISSSSPQSISFLANFLSSIHKMQKVPHSNRRIQNPREKYPLQSKILMLAIRKPSCAV